MRFGSIRQIRGNVRIVVDAWGRILSNTVDLLNAAGGLEEARSSLGLGPVGYMNIAINNSVSWNISNILIDKGEIPWSDFLPDFSAIKYMWMFHGDNHLQITYQTTAGTIALAIAEVTEDNRIILKEVYELPVIVPNFWEYFEPYSVYQTGRIDVAFKHGNKIYYLSSQPWTSREVNYSGYYDRSYYRYCWAMYVFDLDLNLLASREPTGIDYTYTAVSGYYNAYAHIYGHRILLFNFLGNGGIDGFLPVIVFHGEGSTSSGSTETEKDALRAVTFAIKFNGSSISGAKIREDSLMDLYASDYFASAYTNTSGVFFAYDSDGNYLVVIQAQGHDSEEDSSDNENEHAEITTYALTLNKSMAITDSADYRTSTTTGVHDVAFAGATYALACLPPTGKAVFFGSVYKAYRDGSTYTWATYFYDGGVITTTSLPPYSTTSYSGSGTNYRDRVQQDGSGTYPYGAYIRYKRYRTSYGDIWKKEKILLLDGSVVTLSSYSSENTSAEAPLFYLLDRNQFFSYDSDHLKFGFPNSRLLISTSVGTIELPASPITQLSVAPPVLINRKYGEYIRQYFILSGEQEAKSCGAVHDVYLINPTVTMYIAASNNNGSLLNSASGSKLLVGFVSPKISISGYSYKIPIIAIPVDITNPNSVAVEDFNLRIVITDARLANYCYALGANNTIRVFDRLTSKPYEEADGKLYYWVQSLSGDTITMWVRIPFSIGPGETKRIWIYAGGIGMPNEADARYAYWWFYDHFDDVDDWQGWGWSISGGILDLYDDSQVVYIYKPFNKIELNKPYEYYVQIRANMYSGNEAFMPYISFGTEGHSGDSDNSYQWGYNVYSGNSLDIRILQGGSKVAGVSVADNVSTGWQTLKLWITLNNDGTRHLRAAVGSASVELDDTGTWINSTSTEIGIIRWSNCKYQVDYFVIQKTVKDIQVSVGEAIEVG